ncbi:MAG: hypothetical protein L0Z62_37680, partial [Gemmataceae bacterium]|nr:hypothetical protein [Gemmataceae bacterium]
MKPRSTRLTVEVLEDRSVPSTFSVHNLADSGSGSLREAILLANANPGVDRISFAPGVQGTIALTSGELSITDDLTITGPGADRVAVSGNDASRVFHIANTGSDVTEVELSGLTITRGRAAGPSLVTPLGAPFTLGGG